MTTVSKSFTAVGSSASLVAAKGDTVQMDISGTYAGTIQLEEAATEGEQSWKIVAGPYNKANATVSVAVEAKAGAHYRVRCPAFTSGTIVTTVAQRTREIATDKDTDGSILHTLTTLLRTFFQSVKVVGTFEATGAATFDSTVAAVSYKGALTTPASATAAGVAGTMVWDTGFIYVCTATNTWKKVAIATW